MNTVVSFPVDLAGIYSSARQVDRVELIIEAFGGLIRFFNIYCSTPLIHLIDDDNFSDYQVGFREDEDSIVYQHINRRCAIEERNEEDRFDSHHLDILGVTLSELRLQTKALAAYLIECSLATVHEHVFGEAEEEGLRLDHISALSAASENTADRGLPITLILEAELELDKF